MQRFFILDGTFAYKAELSLCTNFDDLAMLMVPKVVGHLCDIDLDKALVSTENGNLALIHRITTLPLNTAFGASEDGSFLYPMFNGNMKLRKTWAIPSDLRWFIVNLFQKGDTGSFYMFGATKDRVYKLPLPNIRADGLMCTGEVAFEGDDVLCKMRTIDSMLENEWQKDLQSYESGIAGYIFRFDATTGEQLQFDCEDISKLGTIIPPIGPDVIRYIIGRWCQS